MDETGSGLTMITSLLKATDRPARTGSSDGRVGLTPPQGIQARRRRLGGNRETGWADQDRC
jgi:hypothetical protein